MNNRGFKQLIHKYFDFLAKSYSYKVEFTDYSKHTDPSIEDGEAQISSSRTLIYVMKSRFDYVLTIGPIGEPSFTRLSPTWILEALSIPIETRPRNTNLSGFE